MNFQYKGNKALWFFIKIIIVITCFYYLYVGISEHPISIKEYLTVLKSINKEILISVLILMLVNWGVESLKWKMLTDTFQKLTFKETIVSIFAGVSSSLATPNRTGEFIGKILFLNPENRKKGVSASLYGSVTQLLITFVMGCIAILINSHLELINMNPSIKIISIILLLFLVILILFHRRTVRYLQSKNINVFESYLEYNSVLLSKISLLSLSRYIVFFTQFYLLLYIFNTGLSFQDAVIGLPLIYIITSIIPSISFAELGIREISAFEILKHFTENTNGVVYATFTLWLINLLLPALIGSFLLLKTNKK